MILDKIQGAKVRPVMPSKLDHLRALALVILLLAFLVSHCKPTKGGGFSYEPEISLPILDETAEGESSNGETETMVPGCKHSSKSSQEFHQPAIDHPELNQADQADQHLDCNHCDGQPEAISDGAGSKSSIGDYISSMLSKQHMSTGDQEPEINHKHSFTFEKFDDRAAGDADHSGWYLGEPAFKSRQSDARYTLDSHGDAGAAKKWQQPGGLRKSWWAWHGRADVASKVSDAMAPTRYPAPNQYPAQVALAGRTPTPTPMPPHPAAHPQLSPALQASWKTSAAVPATPAPPVASPVNQAPDAQLQRGHTGYQQHSVSLSDSNSGGGGGGAIKSKDSSELDQQHQMQLHMPIVMSNEASFVQDPLSRLQDPIRSWIDDDKRILASTPGTQRVASSNLAQSTTNRARESLLNAADIARQIARRSQNRTAPVSTPSLTRELISVRSNDRDTMQIDPLRSWPLSHNLTRRAHYLGEGQLQRIDPFNGNGRTQARLSCQFGDPNARNVSISVSASMQPQSISSATHQAEPIN